jgi:hypothetical protein
VSKKLAELGPHNGLAVNGVDHFLIRLFSHYFLGYVLGKMCFKNRYLCEGGGAKRGESSLLVGLELPPSSRDIIGGINQLCMGRRRLVG